MDYLLILLILLIALFRYDYKNDVSNKVINFLDDKNIVKCSLYFIYIFPIAVSTIVVSISNIETKDVFSPIVSFYATALTITFTVYSFYKTQEKTEKDRNEREEQRNKERKEREEQRDKERKERENKDFELREKELEAKRDYYRPIFVIEQIEKNKKQVRLLMKDDNLYLEHIVFYKYIDGNYIREDEQQLKSNEIINGEVDKSFYITAKTLLGENILFYYFYRDRKKHYFYLKPNNKPIEPLDGRAVEYTPSNINKIWGIYNNLYSLEEKEKHEYDMSNILNDAFPIRINLATNNNDYAFMVYGECYLEGIYNNIFTYINFLTFLSKKYDERLYNLLINLITILEKIITSIYFNTDEINFKNIIKILESDKTAKNNETSHNDKYIEQFLETVKRYLGDSTYIYGVSNGDNDEVIKPVNFLNIIKNSLKESQSSDYDNLDEILSLLSITFSHKIIIIDPNIINNDQLVDQAKHYLLDYQNYFKD